MIRGRNVVIAWQKVDFRVLFWVCFITLWVKENSVCQVSQCLLGPLKSISLKLSGPPLDEFIGSALWEKIQDNRKGVITRREIYWMNKSAHKQESGISLPDLQPLKSARITKVPSQSNVSHQSDHKKVTSKKCPIEISRSDFPLLSCVKLLSFQGLSLSRYSCQTGDENDDRYLRLVFHTGKIRVLRWPILTEYDSGEFLIKFFEAHSFGGIKMDNRLGSVDIGLSWPVKRDLVLVSQAQVIIRPEGTEWSV